MSYRRCVCGALIGALGSGAALAQSFPVSVVVRSGEAIPGAPGLTFSMFDLPSINASGRIAFRGWVNGSTNRVIVAGDPGALSTLVLPGAAVQPGIGAGTWLGGGDPMIADSGRVSFLGGYQSATQGTVTGVFDIDPAAAATVADNRLNPPPLPPGVSVNMGGQEFVGLTRPGLSVFRFNVESAVHTTSDDSAIWVGTPGGLSRVAITRAALPGATPLLPTLLGPPRANDLGAVAFRARSSTTVTIAGQPQLDHGVWLAQGGVVSPVLRAGDPAPGMPAGTLCSDLEPDVTINNAGQVAVKGVYRNLPGSPPVGNAVWAGAPGQMGLVARTGATAPGAPAGAQFEQLFSPVSLADNGALAFRATLRNLPSGSQETSGLWMRDGQGVLSAVAVRATHAPGNPANIVFGDNFESAMNSVGQLVVLASLRVQGTLTDAGTCLYYTDGSGTPERVLKTGDSVLVAPGDFRVLNSLAMWTAGTGLDGQRSGFNALGQVALRVSFTDGSAAILVTTVPAPASAGVLGLGVLVATRRRRAGVRGRCSPR